MIIDCHPKLIEGGLMNNPASTGSIPIGAGSLTLQWLVMIAFYLAG
jgi:hypothetical protein